MESLVENQQISTQQRHELYKMGIEFALEGLDETYFKAQNDEELAIFRLGFQEGIRMQQATTHEKESTEQNKLL